ncbi:hypothetical protein Q428_00225 [Fervidicella metallireducens AeB]|uniref:Uncharacterized protein n=1 Tax=Fervidicella metallireducens AeB TaxID=1403537 RepID=A0A017RYK6_9CLOT|nr:hypothetical protein [Fervidicella metallireducens]EYE89863.1 hypothetical protein Q428_00225 [Fervidicella metallireducens AeB]
MKSRWFFILYLFAAAIVFLVENLFLVIVRAIYCIIKDFLYFK